MKEFINLSERANYVTAPYLEFLTGSITTANSFGTALEVLPGLSQVATTGAWAGTATIQFSPNNVGWYDLENITTNVCKSVTLGCRCYLRVGFKSSYTSGTMNWLVGQGY